MSLNTLRRWSDAGTLTCYRSPGGHRRYRGDDVQALLLSSESGSGRTGRLPVQQAPAGDRDERRASLLTLARVAAEGVGVSECRLSLVDAHGACGLLIAHSRTLESTGVPRDEDEAGEMLPTVREVLRTGRRLVISDLGSTSLLERSEAGALRQRGDAAVLAVPVTVESRTRAVLELVESRAPRAFNGANVAFAEFMARQAANLLVEGGGDREPAAGLPDESVPRATPPSPRPEDLLLTLADRLRHELDAVACDVLRLHDEAQALEPVAASATGDAPPLRGVLYTVADFDEAASALVSGDPVGIDDLAEIDAAGPHLVRRERSGARTVNATPIRLGHEVVGLLELYSREPGRRLGREEQALVDAAAATAALALTDQHDTAVLARRIAQLDDMIAGFGTHSPAMDAESLVQSTLDAIRRRPDFDACTVYRVEDAVATPFPAGDDAGNPVGDGGSWRLGDYPAAAQAVAGRAPVIVLADSDQPLMSPAATARFVTERGLAGVVLTPVVFWDRVVGVLEFGSAAAAGVATAAQVAQVAADLLAAALGSGEVISRLQRRNRDLGLVVEAGLEDTARLSTDEILHAVAERLSELTRTPVTDIYAVEGDTLRGLVSYDGGRFDAEWDGVVLPLRRYPCSRKAVETGEVTVVAALDDPLLDEEGRYSLERWGYQSQLSMPLVSQGRVLGVAELSDYEPRDFAEDMDLIRGLGQVAAHALDNASLFEQVDRRNRTLNELVELSSLASHSRDLDQLVRSVAERVLSAVDAANCDIYRSMEGVLLCVASFDRSGHDDSVLGGKFDLERYPTTAEAVYGHQILTITSPDDPQLSQAERDTYHDYGFSSEVCLPLVIGDELYGLLDVYDTRERDFAEYLGFLRGTAQALAGAFENALLVDQLERRTTILRDVVELGAVASQAHDLETVLTALAVRLRETVGAADCDIFTLKDGMLRCMVSADKDGLDASVVGRILDVDRFPATALAVRTGQPMAIASLDDPHLTDEEREDMAEYGFESELCIPLLGGDRVIGLIDVFDTRPRDYAEYLDFLRSVGQTAAGAIENAVLLEKLERRNAALAELVELGRTASDAGGLTALVRSVGPRVVELMEADGCQVFILRGDSLHCVLTYDDGQFLDDYADRTLDLDLFPSTRAAIAEKSALIIETPEDPRLSDYERGLYLESGSQSEICVPLVLEDRVVGLLDVYDHRRRDYAEHRDFLLRVGQMMAGALENALLMERLEETNETLGLLVESGIEFGATLDRDRLLESVALRLCAAAAAPCCEITTLHGDALRVVARMDHGEADGDHIGTEYPLDHLGLMRIALETRRPAYAEDITDDPRVSDLEREGDPRRGHRAMLCLPLTSRGEVIGVAVVHDDRARTFTRTDLLHSLAQVAAGALANAELYEGIKSMHLGNLKALSSALNAKDYYTLGHAARVAAYMALLGRELGWPDEFLRDVEEAAYLHDIGKIGVPDRVLMKPSGLNEHEWRLMRQHPMFSAEIIHSLFAESLVAGVRHHHERWDGGGYPDGLAAEEIPSVARAMCVADSYDAMSFRRPYRQGLTDEECLEELERCSGVQFDPAMVAAFLRVLARVAEGRRDAAAVAGRAAAALTVEECLALREARGEIAPGRAAVAEKLRQTRAEDARTKHLTLYGRYGRRTVVLADSEAGAGPDSPQPGDEVVSDDELAEAFAGRDLPANVLYVDQWGVWISGVAPVTDADGSVVAVVSADVPAAEGVTEVEGLRSNVAETFASMLHNAAAQSGRTELEAITDGLTGLYNHRYFHERLSEEIERCQEQGTSLALLFCDLDDFRAFNDLHGHGSGDKALRAVARVLESSVRHVDLVARYGGEEFAAILIDTTEPGALEVAERMRAGITHIRLGAGADTLSVSIGVATCPRDATFKEELVDKADWAMYLAKRRGRDTVMTFGAQHGGDTPEQAAVVRPDHVAAMGELVAAREAFRQRRRAAVTQIALGVALATGVPAEDVHAAIGAGTPSATPAGRIVALTETYQALVTERPYRARISEAEALDELLKCPALDGEDELARAFSEVLRSRT